MQGSTFVLHRELGQKASRGARGPALGGEEEKTLVGAWCFVGLAHHSPSVAELCFGLLPIVKPEVRFGWVSAMRAPWQRPCRT